MAGKGTRALARGTYGSAATAAPVNVYCAGVSFRTAPLTLRDRLALDPGAQAAALSRLGCGHSSRPAAISELALLSTCNRIELYAAGAPGARESLVALLADATGAPLDEVAPAAYVLHANEAVRHLCRVAAGLESLAVGEPQILGQVSDAYALAVSHGAAGPVLSAVFRGAIRAGRRARTETGIARHPVSISSVAAQAVASLVPDLPHARALLVGAGEMGSLAAAALRHRGVDELTIMTRTQDDAEAVAGQFGARASTFERLHSVLADSDIVVSSTAAPHFILSAEMVSAAMERRPDRPLVLIDIAVPRDVEPSAGTLPNVTLLDLDALQQHAEMNVAVRQGEIPAVESIVVEEALAVLEWLRRLDVSELIAELRAHTDEIRRRVLQRAARHFSHLPEQDQRRLEWFSASLVNAVLHEPTTRLKTDALGGDGAQYALALRHLFGLEP